MRRISSTLLRNAFSSESISESNKMMLLSCIFCGFPFSVSRVNACFIARRLRVENKKTRIASLLRAGEKGNLFSPNFKSSAFPLISMWDGVIWIYFAWRSGKSHRAVSVVVVVKVSVALNIFPCFPFQGISRSSPSIVMNINAINSILSEFAHSITRG